MARVTRAERQRRADWTATRRSLASDLQQRMRDNGKNGTRPIPNGDVIEDWINDNFEPNRED